MRSKCSTSCLYPYSQSLSLSMLVLPFLPSSFISPNTSSTYCSNDHPYNALPPLYPLFSHLFLTVYALGSISSLLNLSWDFYHK
ncbi:hypothetical protein BC629DRAFT_1533490 [Irpex lacteus]|nr:hypothetical protein BC629DRAFT_1533490 [Irpex lacteus]